MSTPDALFDLPEGYEPPAPAESLTRGQRRKQLVAARITAGKHPLGYVALHADAARVRGEDGLTCGQCRWRILQSHHNKTYPKCGFGDGARISGCESSDIRAWWPACRDFEAGAA